MFNYVLEEIQVFKITDCEKYKSLFLKALNLKYENNTGSMYRITSILYEILAELTADVGFATNVKDNRIIESAEYMRQNFWDPSLSIEELTDEQLMFADRREITHAALEGYILCMILNGQFKWPENTGWFWQSKKDSDLVILKKWIEKGE